MCPVPSPVVRWICRAIAVALVFVALLHGQAKAAERSDVARELLPDLVRLLNVQLPLPRILSVSPVDIEALCKCRARALFIDGDVLISEAVDLDTGEGQAVLLHELVHWAQYNARGLAGDCQEWLARESQASQLERVWRSHRGLALPPPTFYRCVDKGEGK